VGILMNCDNLNIFGITETWTHNGITDDELYVKGFNMLRKNRIVREKKEGGVLLLYIRDTVTALRIEEEDDVSETLWVKLVSREPDAKDLIVGLCYESPTAVNKEIIKMHALLRKYSNVASVILGDFNHGDIDLTTGEKGLKVGNSLI